MSFKKKIWHFYNAIKNKRNINEKMEIQSVQEFQQNQIKKLNSQYKIEVFSTRLRISKAFTVEQKHREY